MKTTMQAQSAEDRLANLGFKSAADHIKTQRSMKWKMRIAFEHFRVVKPEHIKNFQAKLRKATAYDRHYDTLVFTSVERFKRVPPSDVLDKMEAAQNLGCFDAFEVAHIETVKEDPILFGIITGCTNKYFIAQWDDDVKIEDILSSDEG